MQRVLLASLLLAACGSSHQVDDTPAPDGGPVGDMASTTDGGTDGFVDPPARCTIETGEALGEPCFCTGPLAYWSGFLYRQSVGIEVYAADGGDLTLVGTVDERPSAQGGLAIVADHLVSLLGFSERENLVVYSLADPARPVRVGGLALADDAVLDLAAADDQLLVATRSTDESRLTWLDLRDPTTPTERWTVATEGAIASVAIAAGGAFAVEERGLGPERVEWLVWFDGSGALLAEQALTGHRWRRALVAHEGELYVSGPADRTIERFRFDGALEPVDALAIGGDSRAGGALLLRGGRALLSNPLLVADVREPMRELGRGDSPIGDLQNLAAPEGPLQWVYASGGNGLVAARVSCE